MRLAADDASVMRDPGGSKNKVAVFLTFSSGTSEIRTRDKPSSLVPREMQTGAGMHGFPNNSAENP